MSFRSPRLPAGLRAHPGPPRRLRRCASVGTLSADSAGPSQRGNGAASRGHGALRSHVLKPRPSCHPEKVSQTEETPGRTGCPYTAAARTVAAACRGLCSKVIHDLGCGLVCRAVSPSHPTRVLKQGPICCLSPPLQSSQTSLS